jgi:hypothetical protein
MAACKKYYQHHADQARAYVALLNAPYAVLLYILLGYTKEATDYFPEYILTVSPHEIAKLEADAAELQRSINEKDPSLVRHIAAFPRI